MLEALKERSTLAELSAKYGVHSQQITDWKRQFVENSNAAFERSGGNDGGPSEKEKLIEQIVCADRTIES